MGVKLQVEKERTDVDEREQREDSKLEAKCKNENEYDGDHIMISMVVGMKYQNEKLVASGSLCRTTVFLVRLM